LKIKNFRKTVNLEILTPKGIEFTGAVKEIIVPSRAGQIAVLPNHTPLVSVLQAGKMKVVADKTIEKQIEGGILETNGKKAVILLKKF